MVKNFYIKVKVEAITEILFKRNKCNLTKNQIILLTAMN